MRGLNIWCQHPVLLPGERLCNGVTPGRLPRDVREHNRGDDVEQIEAQTTRTVIRTHFLATSQRLALNYVPTSRDRIALLLDPASPFLELCSFAGYDQPHSSPNASLIAGIGSVK
ncbi:hypothetical protein LTR74_012877 [Friedmanniomyces endolithicus]|nr:hypothetical protein LTR74_012877 [Friedmanniomyces endolithicus]